MNERYIYKVHNLRYSYALYNNFKKHNLFNQEPLDMIMVIMDSDMIVRQVSLGQTWCLILSLVSVWSSPLCDMSVCPLLTSATAVFRI